MATPNAATSHTARVQAELAEYLATPESFPIITPARVDHATEDLLARAAAKAALRRFDDQARVSAFGELA